MGAFKHHTDFFCADIMEAVPGWGGGGSPTALHIKSKGFPVAVGGCARRGGGHHLYPATNTALCYSASSYRSPALGKVRHHIPCDAAMLDEVTAM